MKIPSLRHSRRFSEMAERIGLLLEEADVAGMAIGRRSLVAALACGHVADEGGVFAGEAEETRVWAEPVALVDAGAADLVGTGKRFQIAGIGGERREHRRQIEEPLGDDMNDAALALHRTGYCRQPGAEHDRPEALEDFWPDDDIGNIGLVLERHEDDAAGRAGPLANKHQPRD